MEIRTLHENGQIFAIVPLKEFECLRDAAEDAEDNAMLAEALARNEEGFPLALFEALEAGENPVRVLRKYRGLTQAVLAAKANLSRAYLAQIETGAREGTLSSMYGIAQALGVPLDMLVTK